MSRAADTTMYKVRERVAQHACAHAHHPLCTPARMHTIHSAHISLNTRGARAASSPHSAAAATDTHLADLHPRGAAHAGRGRAQGVEAKPGTRRVRTGGKMGGRVCGTCQMRQAADAALNPKAVPAVARSERATHPLPPQTLPFAPDITAGAAWPRAAAAQRPRQRRRPAPPLRLVHHPSWTIYRSTSLCRKKQCLCTRPSDRGSDAVPPRRSALSIIHRGQSIDPLVSAAKNNVFVRGPATAAATPSRPAAPPCPSSHRGLSIH
jgi:hypothetical protein